MCGAERDFGEIFARQGVRCFGRYFESVERVFDCELKQAKGN